MSYNCLMPPQSYYGDLLGEPATGEGENLMQNVGFRLDFAHLVYVDRPEGKDYSRSPLVMIRRPVTFTYHAMSRENADTRGCIPKASGIDFMWDDKFGNCRYRITHDYDTRHKMAHIQVFDYLVGWKVANYRGRLTRKEYIWKIQMIAYWYDVTPDFTGCFPDEKPTDTPVVPSLQENNNTQIPEKLKNADAPRAKPC